MTAIEKIRAEVAKVQEMHSKGPWTFRDLCVKCHVQPDGAFPCSAWQLAEDKMKLAEALEAIKQGEGRFNRDPLTHASNTIDDMKGLAGFALESVAR